ncbi:MAG: hypothetical protein GXY91_00555 [Clostridia bacterium]|nr:hypothetical protein [Clostridia bacterium]
MAEPKRQEQPPVQPGPLPIDPETGQPICPPPVQIDIIKVRKVFQECMHTQVEEVVIKDFTSEETTKANTVECVSATATDVTCTTSGELITVSFGLEVCASVPKDGGGFEEKCATVEDISKTFRLPRATEEGLTPQCHVFPECLFCYISARDPDNNGVQEVTCCVGVLILIKLDAEVQLMIPSYGYPPMPPECEQLMGQCPATYNPTWPPYPQNGPSNGNTSGGGCNGCNG